MRRHLITPDEIGKYSRPISKHMEQELLEAFICEAEDLDIRPAIGDELYKQLLYTDGNAYFDNLINGVWGEDTFGHTFDETFDGDGGMCTAGLKKAIAYYVQARIVKWNNVQVTRFGAVTKNEEYSDKATGTERSNQSGQMMDLADRYLADCIRYIKANPDRYPSAGCCKGGVITNSRTNYRVIGD